VIGKRISNDIRCCNNVTINLQLCKIITNIFTKIICLRFKNLLRVGQVAVKTECHKNKSPGQTILKQLHNPVSVKKMLVWSNKNPHS